MTREDIIRMAREWLPKAYRDGDVGDEPKFTKHNMEVAFAAGAAAERNKLAQWMIDRGYATGHGDTMVELLKELEWQIAERIAAERESIAAWVASQRNDVPATGLEISAAIRARGEK